MYKIESMYPDNVLYNDIDTYEKAIDIANMLIEYKERKNSPLMSELNEMQLEHCIVMGNGNATEDTTDFANKYTIPLYFVNLVLYKYGLVIVEV